MDVVGTQKSLADLDIPSSLGLLTSSKLSNTLTGNLAWELAQGLWTTGAGVPAQMLF